MISAVLTAVASGMPQARRMSSSWLSMGRIGRGHLVFPGFDVAQGCGTDLSTGRSRARPSIAQGCGLTLAPAIPRLTNSRHTIASNGSRCGRGLEGGGRAALTSPGSTRRLRPAGTGENAPWPVISIFGRSGPPRSRARPSSRPRRAASAASRQTACTSSRAFPTAPRRPAPTASCRRASPSRGPVSARRSPMPAVRRRRAAGAQRPELATVWGPVDMLPVGEDCLTLHVWTPALDNVEASGHGLAARRRLLLRLGQLAALRQHQSRPAQRRRGRGRQSSAEYLRPSRSVEHRRRALRPIRQCRPSRSGGGAGVGARARRALRRRSGQRHDLRPVRRRRKGERAAGDAERQGTLPQGDHPERRQRALCRARAHDAPRRRRAEASRPRPGPARRAAGAAAGAPAGGGRAGAGDAAASALSAARPLQFRAGDRRQRAARPSLRSRRAVACRTTCRS